MLGSSGPSVTFQTPPSSLVSLGAGAVPSQSAVRVTSDAFGARMRKVTRWSGSTSGETTVAGLCASALPANVQKRQTCLRFTQPVYADTWDHRQTEGRSKAE